MRGRQSDGLRDNDGRRRAVYPRRMGAGYRRRRRRGRGLGCRRRRAARGGGARHATQPLAHVPGDAAPAAQIRRTARGVRRAGADAAAARGTHGAARDPANCGVVDARAHGAVLAALVGLPNGGAPAHATRAGAGAGAALQQSQSLGGATAQGMMTTTAGVGEVAGERGTVRSERTSIGEQTLGVLGIKELARSEGGVVKGQSRKGEVLGK